MTDDSMDLPSFRRKTSGDCNLVWYHTSLDRVQGLACKTIARKTGFPPISPDGATLPFSELPEKSKNR